MRSKKNATKSDRGYVFEIVNANIVALIVALLAILFSALAVKLFNVSDSTIPVINQIIKSASIFIGCIVALKKPHNGWLRGVICGFTFVMLSFLVFSALQNNFDFGLPLLNDCALGMVSGMISGVIAVNIRNRG
ncbi:MAG: TIGR04086 family membrane protein [Clostridiales bacterium]|nr:TIGR04086 family membrane protein [Clostridiales bacterium]